MITASRQRTLAWKIALSGVLAMSVALGIGRFAFSPLLPMMLHDHSINLTEGGWLATSNYIGYFLGALSCMLIRAEPVRMIRAGLIATVATTLAMGCTTSLELLLLFRCLAGIASAWVFVFTSGWSMQRLSQLGAPALAGLVFTGPGIGILFTGIPVSLMVAAGWSAQQGWLMFAFMGLLLTTLIWNTLGNVPEATRPTQTSAKIASTPALSDRQRQFEIRWLIPGYGLAGLGYIITATFLPVMAKLTLPHSPWPELFWPMLGLSIAIGAALTTRVPVHISNHWMLVLCYLTQALGVVCVIFMPDVSGFICTSILVGLPFSAIVFFAMREARRLNTGSANHLMGLLTAVYGIGQISGPPLATWLVSVSGSFNSALAVAGGALLAGGVIFLMLALTNQSPEHG